ncbi:MAG: hypothetical protein IIZ89_06615, partial [Muribaculaceae bacterium]|nr:hypothetical protein [Muribaculaceae bacterium]
MTENKKLFDMFAPVTPEEWRAKAEVDLKGADFDKRLNDLPGQQGKVDFFPCNFPSRLIHSGQGHQFPGKNVHLIYLFL